MFLFSDISNLGSFGLQNGPNLRAKWALLVIKMGQKIKAGLCFFVDM